MRSLIDGDGHVRYSRGSDHTPVWVTAQAVMALDRKPLPLAPVARKRRSHHAAGRAAARASVRAASTRVAVLSARSHPTAPAATPPALLSYAADAGLVTALVLAPVGLG